MFGEPKHKILVFGALNERTLGALHERTLGALNNQDTVNEIKVGNAPGLDGFRWSV